LANRASTTEEFRSLNLAKQTVARPPADDVRSMVLAASMQARAGEVLHGKKLAFLVGAPRGGTTWLQLLLSRSPSVVTAHETHLFNVFMRSMLDQWNHDYGSGTRIGPTSLLSKEEFTDLLRSVSGVVLAKIAERRPSATIVLDKTPDHVNCWREILDLWPEAHFVHIIRDPRSVVASLRVASKSWASQWASSRISANCERWISDVSNGRRIRWATENYQEVFYEELISDGPAILLRLLERLGVQSSLEECRRYADQCRIDNLKAGKLDNAPFAMTNRNQSYRIGAADSWRVELSKWDVALVERLAGPLMAELGYAPANGRTATSVFVAMGWTAREMARTAKRRLRRLAEKSGLVRGMSAYQ
jgi:hypothetical protein